MDLTQLWTSYHQTFRYQAKVSIITSNVPHSVH